MNLYSVKITTPEEVVPKPLYMADLAPGTYFRVLKPNIPKQDIGLIVNVAFPNARTTPHVIWLRLGRWVHEAVSSVEHGNPVVPLAPGETIEISA